MSCNNVVGRLSKVGLLHYNTHTTIIKIVLTSKGFEAILLRCIVLLEGCCRIICYIVLLEGCCRIICCIVLLEGVAGLFVTLFCCDLC